MRLLNGASAFPVEIEWNLTWACNAHCYFCSTGTQDRSVFAKNVDVVIDKIRTLNPFAVTLSGGEPLTHPEIEYITKSLLGSGFAVNITTNGALLNRLTPETLSRLNWIRVSLHSIEQENAEKIMGKSYRLEHVLSNLRTFQTELSNKLSLFAIITHDNINYESWEKFFLFAEEVGATKVEFGFVKLLGWANNVHMPEFAKIKRIFSDLMLDKNKYRFSIVVPNIADERPKCLVRSVSISIHPDGSVRSCAFDNDDILFNVYTDDVQSRWKDRKMVEPFCDRCAPGGYLNDGKQFSGQSIGGR